MSSQRPKLEARKHSSQHESISSSRLNYIPPPPRLRSYTDPTLQSLYNDDTGSTRLIHTAPESTNENDDQISFIEDSEDEMAVLLSSASTSLPKLSSMMFNNNFETSMDTSEMNLNLYHCNESSQLNNDNFNEQDFAMPADLVDIHDFYHSQNMIAEDTDVILVTSQKEAVKERGEIAQDQEPLVLKVSVEQEDYDDEFESNISVDNEKSESMDKSNMLLTVGNIFRLDQVMGTPKEEEILECSTQCDEDEFKEVKQLKKDATVETESVLTLSKTDSSERKIESFPGEVQIIKVPSPEVKDVDDVAEVNIVEEKLVELADEKLIEKLEENDDSPVTCTENPDTQESKANPKLQHKEATQPELENDEKVVLKELKYFNAAEEEKPTLTTKDVLPTTKSPKKSKSIASPLMGPSSSSIELKNSRVIARPESKVVNDNKENHHATISATKSTKLIRKRIGSKPLSEICNQQPRSRVGLSKRVRINSLHNNMKKRKTT